jgi:MarC family membrane protein
MDPLGNAPVFLSILKDVDRRRWRKIIARELIIALAVLIIFLLCGRYILGLLQISEPALSIAGGIILFLIALKMIFSIYGGGDSESIEGEPLIVPLAIPLVAGPSAITTVLLLVTREPTRLFDWSLALVVAWLATAIILLLAVNLSKILGKRGLLALQRLMGMILTTIAVQMFLTGLTQYMAQR